jgi:hypothetical protein
MSLVWAHANMSKPATTAIGRAIIMLPPLGMLYLQGFEGALYNKVA